jgi:hypothetical protein
MERDEIQTFYELYEAWFDARSKLSECSDDCVELTPEEEALDRRCREFLNVI